MTVQNSYSTEAVLFQDFISDVQFHDEGPYNDIQNPFSCATLIIQAFTLKTAGVSVFITIRITLTRTLTKRISITHTFFTLFTSCWI